MIKSHALHGFWSGAEFNQRLLVFRAVDLRSAFLAGAFLTAVLVATLDADFADLAAPEAIFSILAIPSSAASAAFMAILRPYFKTLCTAAATTRTMSVNLSDPAGRFLLAALSQSSMAERALFRCFSTSSAASSSMVFSKLLIFF